MKRLFFIIAGIVIVIGLAIGVHFLVFSKKSANLTVGNPFSGTTSSDATPSEDLPTTGTLQNAGTSIAPRFVKITDGPVSFGTVATDIVSSTTNATGSSTATSDIDVHFIDRASGNVYSYLSKARSLTRISNKTLPGIQTASWLPDGSRAYVQFLSASGGEEKVSTYALSAKGGDGFLLQDNLTEAASLGTNSLFTLFSGSTGSVGTVSNIDGSNQKTLFSSVLSALTVHTTTGDLFATNKPSAQINGYGFEISRKTGGFSRILGPFPGLTVLPNADGSSVLYSYIDAGTYHLRVLDTKTRISTAFPIATLSEKCVWAQNSLSIYCAVPTNLTGDLPDSWYQGATIFTDRIWKIDLTQRVASLVLDPYQIGKVNVDAVTLSVDPSEKTLVFTDKHTGALYAYALQ